MYSRIPRLVLGGYAFVTVVLLVLPGLILIPISFTSATYVSFPPRGFSLRWYEEVVTDSQWHLAALNSFAIASSAAAVAVVCGVPAALGLRHLRLPTIEAVVAVPLLIPVVVLGVGLYRWYLENGWVGSRLGLVFPQALLGTPAVIVTVLAALQRIDPELERTALVLGANRYRAVWSVTLPLALPAILAGGFFAFIVSFDEVVLAFFLTSGTMRTIPMLLYQQAIDELRPTLAVVSTLLLLLAAGSVAIGTALATRSTGSRQ